MGFPTREEVRSIREKYPEGTKVRLVSTADPTDTGFTALIDKTGVVTHVDDAGHVHVVWETGSKLSVCLDIDTVEIIKN